MPNLYINPETALERFPAPCTDFWEIQNEELKFKTLLVKFSILYKDLKTAVTACAAGGPHHRMRRRAQAVLAHHRGFSIDQLVVLFATHRNVVSRWLGRWQRWGLAGLAEGARSGRPPKQDEVVKKK